MTGVPPSGSGCQPAASAAEEASSQSGIPNAVRREWAERIARQFETDATDAIEEGIQRGALLSVQAQWKGPPYEYGVTWGPQIDRDRAFVALVEAVGIYIYSYNGPKVLQLKRAWNAAFSYAKDAASAIEAATAGETPQSGSAEGESATAESGDAQ